MFKNDKSKINSKMLNYFKLIHKKKFITNKEFASLMDISISTLSKWIKEDRMKSSTKFKDFSQILDILIEAIPEEAINIWLHSHNGYLKDRKPIDLLKQGDPKLFEKVEDVALDLRDGVF